MKFEVREHETLADCLARMREAGYTPVRRMEKPIFHETKDGEVAVLKQQIVFVGRKIEE
ncbi:NETI motif-containing protein [Macrococcus equipercicus]|uniref:NETI motif-containing protein n=1 Tax=Macrococcus equipercicus TaxID=69967 RepID=A0ABQ6R769_9STAP|nr:NETI motif-containing protein [Macrococcus equipercicus]KAA1037715.1 NETI motif-containing protein [Macrococcus equipercicus]